MHVVRSTLRTVMLLGYLAGAGLELLFRRSKTQRAGAEWLQRVCARVLSGLGVPLVVEGSFPGRGALISNHMGYLDIVALASVHPSVFVSKAEVERWPLIGSFARTAGTVFVQRGKGGSAARAESGLRAASDAGLPVIFFPEGTTSNGQGMLQFRTGMLAQVLAAGQPVTAAFLTYSFAPGAERANGPGISLQDDVAYWGDRVLALHIFRFLGLRGVRAHLRIANAPIAFSPSAEDRHQAALEAQQAVAALAGHPVKILPGKGEGSSGEHG